MVLKLSAITTPKPSLDLVVVLADARVHTGVMSHGKTAKKNQKSTKSPKPALSLRSVLRCPPGPVDVSKFDPAATPLFPGKGKADAPAQTALLAPLMDNLQERLYANGRVDGGPTPKASVLLVLQGMDTAGKSGVVAHVIGLVDPQGISIRAFKAPTAEERQHDFLWRIRRALPEPGLIGVFDRSHYEDVLIQRVEAMAPPDEIEARYGLINDFERELTASGTRIIKCYLNMSNGEQKKRILARLDDPTKYWKLSTSDLPVRLKWDQYMDAYSVALTRCNTDYAPWYVIPSDKKWYRNWAIAKILLETLQDMNLTWPPATFDIEAEKAKVKAS